MNFQSDSRTIHPSHSQRDAHIRTCSVKTITWLLPIDRSQVPVVLCSTTCHVFRDSHPHWLIPLILQYYNIYTVFMTRHQTHSTQLEVLGAVRLYACPALYCFTRPLDRSTGGRVLVIDRIANKRCSFA